MDATARAPCPTCRSAPDLCELLPGGNAYWYCGRCGWRGPVRRNHEVALAAWNRRTPDRETRDELARLRALVAAYEAARGPAGAAEPKEDDDG